MDENILAQLQALDTAVITEAVRKDQHDPGLTLLSWKVEPLSHEKIIHTTGGLFRFSGTSQNPRGEGTWAIVLKCINEPKGWSREPTEWAYWKREPLMFQSDLLDELPQGLRAPRSYGAIENELGVWLWLEHIQEATGKHWPLEHFQRAARQLGQFQGAYLCGIHLPQQPWLCRPFFRSVWAENDYWAPFMDPLTEDNAWKSPIVQRAFQDRYRSRILRLLDEKERFFEVNDRLPQVLCHNDAHRRNLMWTHSSKTGQEELVALDWAFVGAGAIGNDLGELVGNSLYFLDHISNEFETFSEAILENYLAGVSDNGVDIDPRIVRLGYLISLTFFMGVQLPGWAAMMITPESGVNVQAMYGHSPEEVLNCWLRLDDFILNQADVARDLIRELGL